MTYADPHACPACRGRIDGDAACPHCGFVLGSFEAHRLWGLFVEADRLVAQGRARQQADAARAGHVAAPQRPVVEQAAAPTAAAAAPAAATASPAAAGAVEQPMPQYRPAPAPVATNWSTGSVLLGLGALCLVVAALIFATVAWGSLGILGRAVILLAVTAVVGACAAWATRRRLTATAEALWAVFLAFIGVDVLAAVAEGLFGLDWGDFPAVSLVWTAVVLAVAVIVVLWGRSVADHELVMPQLAAGLITWLSTPALLIRLGDAFGAQELWFWAALIALALPLAVAAVGRRTRMRWTVWPALVVAACVAALLLLLAFSSLVADSPVVTLVEALPSLALVVGLLAAAFVLRSARPWLAAAAAVVLVSVIGLAVSGWAWDRDATQTVGMVAVSVAVAVLAVAGTRSGSWSAGWRWAAAVVSFAPVVWLIAMAMTNVERIDTASWFSSTNDLWVRPAEVEFDQGAWVIAVVAPLVLAWWVARRWPAPLKPAEQWWGPVAQLTVALAAVTSVSATYLPFLVHAVVLIVAGTALAFGLRRAPWPVGLVPPAVVLIAMFVVPGESAVTAWTWGLAAAGLALCALIGHDSAEPVRRAVSAVSAGLATAAALATCGQVLELMELDTAWWGTVMAALAAAVLVLTMALDELPWHRLAVEIVAGLTFLVALTSGTQDAADLALKFTIGAVAAAAVGLLDDDRRYLRWVGAGLVGCAWIARLAASGVGTVEAYTAPFAVALLAAGVWRLRTDPAARTWLALTPGLTMALLPSLPQALWDPTSLRAGLLVLVSLVVLGAGVALRWGAAVAAGASVVLLVVLANILPTAIALPRWILIAIMGLALLVIGTTWEKRVAEGRALVARLADLR